MDLAFDTTAFQDLPAFTQPGLLSFPIKGLDKHILRRICGKLFRSHVTMLPHMMKLNQMIQSKTPSPSVSVATQQSLDDNLVKCKSLAARSSSFCSSNEGNAVVFKVFSETQYSSCEIANNLLPLCAEIEEEAIRLIRLAKDCSLGSPLKCMPNWSVTMVALHKFSTFYARIKMKEHPVLKESENTITDKTIMQKAVRAASFTEGLVTDTDEVEVSVGVDFESASARFGRVMKEKEKREEEEEDAIGGATSAGEMTEGLPEVLLQPTNESRHRPLPPRPKIQRAPLAVYRLKIDFGFQNLSFTYGCLEYDMMMASDYFEKRFTEARKQWDMSLKNLYELKAQEHPNPKLLKDNVDAIRKKYMMILLECMLIKSRVTPSEFHDHLQKCLGLTVRRDREVERPHARRRRSKKTKMVISDHEEDEPREEGSACKRI